MFDLDRWRARRPWLDAVLRVHERFNAVAGGPLASSLGLAAFLSLFPLLLVAIAAVGFVASGSDDLAARVIEDLGLEGRAAEVITAAISTAEGTRRAATVVGLVGLVWAGLGVVGALQAACNAVWQVRGRGLVDRAVALGWLAGAGTLFLASVALGPLRPRLPWLAGVGAVVVGVALTAAVVTWTYNVLGNQPVPWRAHVLGAVVVGVGTEVLKVIGTVYVPALVASSSALYGSIGVVFAILAWLLLYARLVVYGAVINVVRWEAQEGTRTVEVEVPRMGDDVPLTADRGGAIDETRSGAG